MGNQILPGIKKIEYCMASELRLEDKQFLQEGDTVKPQATFTDLDIVGLAKGEIKEKLEDGEWIYETKISFFTKSVTPARSFLSYRITTVNGERYLLGTNTRPFVVREYKKTLPDQDTQKQGYDITLSYKNRHSLLLIEI